MQCRNISSVVDKKSEIVLLLDSTSNFDRYCLKSIIVSTEYRTLFYFQFIPADFWSDPKKREKIQRPYNTTSIQSVYQLYKTDGHLYSMQREKTMTSVSKEIEYSKSTLLTTHSREKLNPVKMPIIPP